MTKSKKGLPPISYAAGSYDVDKLHAGTTAAAKAPDDKRGKAIAAAVAAAAEHAHKPVASNAQAGFKTVAQKNDFGGVEQVQVPDLPPEAFQPEAKQAKEPAA